MISVFKLNSFLTFCTLLTNNTTIFTVINITIRKKFLVIFFIVGLNSFFEEGIIGNIVNVNLYIISVILGSVKTAVVSVSKSSRNGRGGASVLLTKNKLILNSDCYNNRNIPFIYYLNFRLLQ